MRIDEIEIITEKEFDYSTFRNDCHFSPASTIVLIANFSNVWPHSQPNTHLEVSAIFI